MTTESELLVREANYANEQVKIAIAKAQSANEALDDFKAKPKVKVYKNMPVIVNSNPVYASHIDGNGILKYFSNGDNSYTSSGLISEVFNWQPDYDRPSLLNWRPVDETIPDHSNWLLKRPNGEIINHYMTKNDLLMAFNTYECLPLYKDK